MSKRKLTTVWLFNKTFGKDPTLSYINSYHPKEEDAVYEMDGASYQRLDAPIRYKLTKEVPYNSIVNCPYLMFENQDERRYYAFITDCKYENDGMAQLTFKIDPFTTYLTDGIIDNMFVERQSGSFSNPDPELSFTANQFMDEINVMDENSSLISDNNDSGQLLLHDIMLLYVRNNYNTSDGINSTTNVATDGLADLPSLNKLIKYYANGKAELQENKLQAYLNEIVNRTNNGEGLIDPNGSGKLTPVQTDEGEFNGSYTGYDVYLVTNMTENNDIIVQVMDNPIFYGSTGTNIIGAEYRKLMINPLFVPGVEEIPNSHNCYKLTMQARELISKPYELKIGDFKFPDNAPKAIRQAPYFKRLFVSNNGSSTISFNPNASATSVDSQDSNLTSINIIDSAEKGSPIVYVFNSSDSNIGKQYYVDTADRSIPVFADPRMIEYYKNIQRINNETELATKNLVKRLDNIKRKYEYQVEMNNNNYDPVNVNRLKFNQKTERTNLTNQQNNSTLNLSDNNALSIKNLARSNTTKLANLNRSINVSESNLNKTQNVEKNILNNQQKVEDEILDNNYALKNDINDNNFDHTRFVNKNEIALNSLNKENANKLERLRIENAQNLSRANMDLDYKYAGQLTRRKVLNTEQSTKIDALLSAEDILNNQDTAKKVLFKSLGLGAAGSGIEAVAKGFQQMIPSIIAGAVTAEVALQALDDRQLNERANFNHKWGSVAIDSSVSGAGRYLMDYIPGWYELPSFSNYAPEIGSNKWLTGADQTVGEGSNGTIFFPEDHLKSDIYNENGLGWSKVALNMSQEVANVLDEYKHRAPGKINNTRKYADEIADVDIDNRNNVFNTSTDNLQNNTEDSYKTNVNNISLSKDNDIANLNKNHSAQTFSLNNRQKVAYNNLVQSNIVSKDNTKADIDTSKANLNNSTETAMNNLIRDINRENENLANSQSAQTNSLEVDWILSSNGIIASIVYSFLDEYNSYYIDYVTRLTNFANTLKNASLRSSAPVTTANYWAQVFSKLNMFKVYDISINARELRYCINYIERYGSYCGINKYGITFEPNTYIRTKDYHMAPKSMPTWAADEISEHLNAGVYIRE